MIIIFLLVLFLHYNCLLYACLIVVMCCDVGFYQEKHISEVLEASTKLKSNMQDKILQKMETTLRNREDQLKQIVERLQEHVSREKYSALLFYREDASKSWIMLTNLSQCRLILALYKKIGTKIFGFVKHSRQINLMVITSSVCELAKNTLSLITLPLLL